MALQNGYYEPSHVKKVTHWPAPDANGDGAEVWVDEFDDMGNLLGRNQKLDNNGNPVYDYSPPPGFKNVQTRQPGADGKTDNYVKATERGDVYRHPQTREAVPLKPGQTLVEHADGTFTYLNDDYSRKLFEDAHRKVDAPSVVKAGGKKATSGDA